MLANPLWTFDMHSELSCIDIIDICKPLMNRRRTPSFGAVDIIVDIIIDIIIDIITKILLAK